MGERQNKDGRKIITAIVTFEVRTAAEALDRQPQPNDPPSRASMILETPNDGNYFATPINMRVINVENLELPNDGTVTLNLDASRIRTRKEASNGNETISDIISKDRILAPALTRIRHNPHGFA